MSLTDSDEVIEKKPFPIYLFNFPEGAIANIYFGSKVEAGTKERIKNKFKSDECFKKIKLYQARLADSSYEILFEEEKL